MNHEYTRATTTIMYNQKEGRWEDKIFERLDLPKDIFPEIIIPEEEIDNISNKVCSGLEIKTIPVIATATHDIPSAVAGIPIVSKKLLPESLTVLT